MLVAGDRLADMEAALAPLAVVPVEQWGAGDHRVLLGYHAPTDSWITLDVEHTLGYGPHASFLVNWLLPALRTEAAAGVLARRRRSDIGSGIEGVWVPAPDDAFWTLLLHCIVDKRAVADRHRRRLGELAAEAEPSGELGMLVSATTPPGWDARRIIDAVAAGDWDALLAVGAELPQRAAATNPLGARLGALARGVGRLGETAWRMRQGRGFSVAILGPDGSGKSTLSAGIAEGFGVPARRVPMGLWTGEEGQERSAVAAGLAAASRPIKVWRRYLAGRFLRATGKLVVFDRYLYDARLPGGPPLGLAKRAFFAFLGHAAPGPQLVLVLDLPSEVVIERRPEESPDHLASLRERYLDLAGRLPRAHVMPGTGTPDELRIEATDRIWRAWAARKAGGGARSPGQDRGK